MFLECKMKEKEDGKNRPLLYSAGSVNNQMFYRNVSDYRAFQSAVPYLIHDHFLLRFNSIIYYTQYYTQKAQSSGRQTGDI